MDEQAFLAGFDAGLEGRKECEIQLPPLSPLSPPVKENGGRDFTLRCGTNTTQSNSSPPSATGRKASYFL